MIFSVLDGATLTKFLQGKPSHPRVLNMPVTMGAVLTSIVYDMHLGFYVAQARCSEQDVLHPLCNGVRNGEVGVAFAL